MVIQIIKFESQLSESEVLAVAEERAPQFRAMPGLVQKYYARLAEPNCYAGIYVWDSEESMAAYRASDLAAKIPSAYKIQGVPRVETGAVVLQLRG